jgi:hypothetical protein
VGCPHLSLFPRGRGSKAQVEAGLQLRFTDREEYNDSSSEFMSKGAEQSMAEGAIQPDIEHDQTAGTENRIIENSDSIVEEKPQVEANTSTPAIIWTPHFIVAFALTLVFGLSLASLLTQGWLNNYYTGQWVFQVYVILISACWLTLFVLTHSRWVRFGSIFGCIWALFITLNIILSSQHSDLASRVLAIMNAATCLALLGSYICLSIDNTPFNRLDAWFFGLAPIVGSIAVVLVYFLTPANEHSPNTLENAIATIALVLSLLVWWIRPTSWKSQPGPTFLFGCVPLILLILAISGPEFTSSNYFLAHVLGQPIPNLLTNETDFFISQVALLCLFLGIMRVIQSERVTTMKR